MQKNASRSFSDRGVLNNRGEERHHLRPPLHPEPHALVGPFLGLLHGDRSPYATGRSALFRHEEYTPAMCIKSDV